MNMEDRIRISVGETHRKKYELLGEEVGKGNARALVIGDEERQVRAETIGSPGA